MSFRLKTILGVALIEALLLGVLLTSGLRFMAGTAEREFMQRAEAIGKAFSVAGKNALIASDLGALEALASDMLDYPGVVYARIRSAEGQVLASAGDRDALARPPRVDRDLASAADGLFNVAENVIEAGTAFGRVELGLRSAELSEQNAKARRYGLGLGALEMVLVAVFSWVLGSYLTRQLVQLAQASRRIAEGELGAQVPVRGRDELADTALAFNRMSARVAESYGELRASEAAGRRVLENILDGIVELDASGRVLRASARAAGIVGHAERELVGRPLADVLVASQLRAFDEALRQVSGGTPQRIESRVRQAGGAERAVEAELTTIPGGGDATVLVVLRDIQQRVEARESLHLRSRIIDSSVEGIIIADARKPGWPVIFVNPGFERITGYPAAEVLGRSCSILQRAETHGPELQRLRAALDRAEPVRVLLRNFTRDGVAFWNDLQVAPIHDDAGTVTHFVGLQNDVTARIEAERALAEREAHLSRVLNATHDGIVVFDADAHVVSFNQGAETLFGIAAGEAQGRSLYTLVPALLRGAGAEADATAPRLADSGLVGTACELQATRADGQPLWMALRLVPLEGSSPPRYLGVFHDVTERKRGELELRTAKDAAEAAANAKSEFLANMSHEIRTPLHGVLGAMEMLGETPLTGQQQRYIETARTSANMLLGVIDEILDFSRLEAGKLRIETLDFDLHRTIEDVTAVLAPRAHAKRLELACYIAPEVPQMVSADPIRLRQVLVNLVGNAIKFTEHGEVVVSCSVLPDPAGSRLGFEVRDTGIGIAPAKHGNLFAPFTQADSSTSRRYGGSGLGLSISRRLVELMGGRIGFDSQDGQGSRFWFDLPLRLAQTRQRPGRSTTLAGTRVLVVDDNATNRVILHRYLTSWNAQSGSASGGEEALAKMQDAAAAGHPYDLVLMDLNMPSMDGYALVRSMQADAALAPTPVIMLSSSMQDPTRMTDLRVDVWLDKPVRQSDLHDAIATVLGARAVEPVPAPAPAGRGPQFRGERVLLVEDNAVTRELGVQMLAAQGLDVEAVELGADAVAAVQQRPYDVVLMDVQMPGMDGYQATREIRRWESGTGRVRLPIIALTAHALPADRERCLAAGMDDYVVKPYSGATIGATIARWLMPPGGGPRAAAAHRTVLDVDRLAEVRAVMKDDFVALARKAGQAITGLLAEVEERHRSGDTTGAYERVHRLKNTAGDIGAQRLHEMAAEAERLLQAGDFAAQDLARLAAEGEAAARALATLEPPAPDAEEPSRTTWHAS